MKDYFKVLVDKDSVEAWEALKGLMPWRQTPSELKELVQKHGLEYVEIDADNLEQLQSLVKISPYGTFLYERWCDPSLEIGEGFYAQYLNCQQLDRLVPTVGIPEELDHLYQAKNPIETADFSSISFLVIHCPRCQLRSSQGDLNNLPEFCAFDDCIACGGSGEWAFDLGDLLDEEGD
jgi:hypothetical protein